MIYQSIVNSNSNLSFFFAIKALKKNKARALLTTLGVVFGVASVISMLAIGKGAEKEILSMIKMVGSNNIVINKKVNHLSNDLTEINKKSNGLTIFDVKSIKASIPSVINVSPFMVSDCFVLYKSRSDNLQMVGVTEAYFNMLNIQPDLGRNLKYFDVSNSSPVCVIGSQVKHSIFGNRNPIGEYIKCGNTWLEVIGTLPQNGISENKLDFGIVPSNQSIYIPITSFLLRFRNKLQFTKKMIEDNNKDIRRNQRDKKKEVKPDVDAHQIDKIILQTNGKSDLRIIANIASNYLFRVHNRTLDFEVQIPENLLKQEQKSKRIFNIVLGVIAGISLLVGGIGIMNIMLASVIERTKEIGLRMAIGASQNDIVSQFLFEALLISVGGGLIGIILGIISSFAIEWFSGVTTVISFLSIITAFSLSLIVGIIFGIAPAQRAAKQDPVISLRS